MIKNWKEFNENFEEPTQPEKHSLNRCSGCHEEFPTTEEIFLCPTCEDDGWWIDPAGGVHAPDNDDDFEDPAAMYEKLHNEFYNK